MRWPVREERLLTVHTFIVSLLKTWKVTVVGIECDDAANAISRRPTPEIVLSRKKIFFLNSASKLPNWIIVDILKYLY